MTWLGWRVRLAWARQREGHLAWLLSGAYSNLHAWVDDPETLKLRLIAAGVLRQRLELAEP